MQTESEGLQRNSVYCVGLMCQHAAVWLVVPVNSVQTGSQQLHSVAMRVGLHVGLPTVVLRCSLAAAGWRLSDYRLPVCRGSVCIRWPLAAAAAVV
jgi:hypothetical protein